MSYFLRTKTGRLKAPKYKKLPFEELDLTGNTVDWKGDPVAKPNDFVYLSGLGVSAGTVGRVVLIYPPLGSYNQLSAGIECLDGRHRREWLWGLSVIPYNAVQEVKEFYIQDGRPERIKVTW